MKKIKSLFIFLYVLTTLLYTPNLVFSDEIDFAGGSGLENDPYQIENCEQLQNISSFLVGEYHFILNNNIDCSVSSTWDEGQGFFPIGGSRNYFRGYFDGNNKKISNLTINRTIDLGVGLFGYIYMSEIKNVILENFNITGQDKVGGLVGSSLGSEIRKVGLVNVSISGENKVGGLIGYTENTHIENVYASGAVTGDTSIGGLVGEANADFISASIYNSYSSVDVVGNSEVGGLIGYNNLDQVKNSYSTGHIQGDLNTGGLIGKLFNDQENYLALISNSGWYKSPNNLGLKAIGFSNDISCQSGCDVTYNEIDESVFYLKSHGVYDQGNQEAWDFSSLIWHQWNDRLPLFEGQPQPERRKRSSGSSSSLLNAFVNEQQAKNSINSIPAIELKTINPPTLIRIIRKTIPRTTGDDILAFQKYLNSIGYNVGVEDGVYGTKTQRAVINFQIANNLSPDGSIGPLTRALMK